MVQIEVLIRNTDIEEPTGLYDSQNKEIRIFPNPLSDYLRVIKQNSLTINYSLTNIKGKVVLNGELLNTTEIIDFSNFEKGIYLLQLENYGTYKIVKN